MPVNITEEFVRNLITQIETLTAQNQALTATVAELNQTIKELKKRQMWVYGLDMNGENWCAGDLTGPIAVVVGSEGRGISRLVREQCDQILSLPMQGSINSLNASVACGIVLYEVCRQRAGIRAKN